MPERGGARAARFFFMQVGSLTTVVVYFTVYAVGGYSLSALRTALLVALAVQTGYVALAWSQDQLKQFDLGFWLLFAIGAVSVLADLSPLVWLYQLYSPALMFTMLGLTAALPPLLGYDWFTSYFMQRTLPRWQQKLPATARIGRMIGIFWVVLFLGAVALCVYAPLDWRFAALYPNLLVFGVGPIANKYLPAVYLKLFPPEAPTTAEAMIMGMPFVFDRRAAAGVRVEIQFRVSGATPGDYWLRIAEKRCESFEGDAATPAVTVHTPDSVWMRIVRRELDGAQALADGLYRIEGDVTVLGSLSTWFPAPR